jgi:hypothetical protein
MYFMLTTMDTSHCEIEVTAAITSPKLMHHVLYNSKIEHIHRHEHQDENNYKKICILSLPIS